MFSFDAVAMEQVQAPGRLSALLKAGIVPTQNIANNHLFYWIKI